MKDTAFFILGGSHNECLIGRWPGWQTPVIGPYLHWGRGGVGWFGENNPGLRFKVDLPDYAYIEKVRLRVRTEYEKIWPMPHRLFGRLCLDAPPWTSRADYLAAPLTKAYCQDKLLPWDDDWYYYFDITDIFLEIINQPGFESGNHIALLFYGPLTNMTGHRRARSWAGDPFNPAIIICNYSKDDPPPAPGEPRPPDFKSNPPIPTDRFAVTDLVYCFQGTDVLVTALTDVPCFLYLRWTGIQPERHKTMTEIRGRPWYADIKNCFVQFQDIPQIEPNDCLFHTFRWPGWQYCIQRWFYIWGKLYLFWEPWSATITQYHPWTSERYEPPQNIDVQQGNLYFECNDIPACWLYTETPFPDLKLLHTDGKALMLTNLFGDAHSDADWGVVTLQIRVKSLELIHTLEYFAFRGPNWVALGDDPIFFNSHVAFPVPANNKIRNILEDWQLLRRHLELSTAAEGAYVIDVWLGINHHEGVESGYTNWGPIDFYPTPDRLPSVSNTAYWRIHFGDWLTALMSEPWTRLYVPPPDLEELVTEYWST